MDANATLDALRRYADGTVDDLEIPASKPVTYSADSKVNANWLHIPDFDAFETRALGLLGQSTREAMVAFIGCSPPTYQKAIRSSAIQFGWLAKFVWFYAINPLYLVYGGQHKKYLCESDLPQLNIV